MSRTLALPFGGFAASDVVGEGGATIGLSGAGAMSGDAGFRGSVAGAAVGDSGASGSGSDAGASFGGGEGIGVGSVACGCNR
jgi:hypothetical protein